MNAHFQRSSNEIGDPPKRAFARIDHVEMPLAGGREVLIALDAADADWIQRQGKEDPRFNLNDPEPLDVAWRSTWMQPKSKSPSPFARLPLVRIEVEIDLDAPLFELEERPNYEDEPEGGGLADLEARWFELKISDTEGEGIRAKLYTSFYSAPIPVWIKSTMPSVTYEKSLSAIFSLSHLPSISEADLANLVSHVSADYLAVYDVGQGNANALLDSWRVPGLYYDLGAGVYRNQHTTPSPLIFCFTHHPPILLSHWDADHWAGAYATQVNGAYPALDRTWIAPVPKSTGPLHVAFAHDVLSQGGKFYVYSSIGVGSANLLASRVLHWCLGSGTTRNHSGLVLSVESSSPSPRSWLLTGDCDYHYFWNVLQTKTEPPVAIVTPHHGATLHAKSLAPMPLAGSPYRRAIYSFGAGNIHGSSGTGTQHPTQRGIDLHKASGWSHGAWMSAGPGYGVAGGDILATQGHPHASLGGILVGWSTAPRTFQSPCHGACSISPIQS